MKRFIVDRFEGNFAVCETEEKVMVNILKENLPQEVKEGSILYQNVNGLFVIDNTETHKQKELIKKKLKNLWK